MAPQSEKERQIAAAALRVFSRYGLKRATMNDIAEEAGVVRQTLYNVFANKDEVINGTLLLYTDTLRQKTQDAWKEAEDLPTKLDLLFEHYILASWDAVRATPDAADLESGGHAAVQRAMCLAGEELEAMICQLFTPDTDAIERNGHTLPDFASFVNAALMGLKYGVDDRATLVRHLATLKAMILLTTTS
ncbi:TetR/AcrR family transcriptional regulator [Rhodobacteraceae bacterium N5(2021)]|uniref:TetR/AcrR family transcriptional regulator n=1 Tax=Gymnodinialimonas phycosphaerae TaxID=2841589 RepID=A0A975TT14_9RHOB|nr:TetR/AcrR family transcriptional regulator [Gymnodinialimonas phycosphaerae]MBY4894039.1 TetR/AcrR family transcriptional regulator [Gymnodinialimonas phycosphaerae]